jgi:hypothetical protein
LPGIATPLAGGPNGVTINAADNRNREVRRRATLMGATPEKDEWLDLERSQVVGSLAGLAADRIHLQKLDVRENRRAKDLLVAALEDQIQVGPAFSGGVEGGEFTEGEQKVCPPLFIGNRGAEIVVTKRVSITQGHAILRPTDWSLVRIADEPGQNLDTGWTIVRVHLAISEATNRSPRRHRVA